MLFLFGLLPPLIASQKKEAGWIKRTDVRFSWKERQQLFIVSSFPAPPFLFLSNSLFLSNLCKISPQQNLLPPSPFSLTNFVLLAACCLCLAYLLVVAVVAKAFKTQHKNYSSLFCQRRHAFLSLSLCSANPI